MLRIRFLNLCVKLYPVTLKLWLICVLNRSLTGMGMHLNWDWKWPCTFDCTYVRTLCLAWVEVYRNTGPWQRLRTAMGLVGQSRGGPWSRSFRVWVLQKHLHNVTCKCLNTNAIDCTANLPSIWTLRVAWMIVQCSVHWENTDVTVRADANMPATNTVQTIEE